MVLSDAAVIGRIRAGDAEAFGELVRRYHTRCARLAVRALGDPDEAADVVQDAFISAFHALDRYEEQDRFGAWLLCIVANRCRSAVRNARRRESAGVAWGALQDTEAAALDREDHALRARLDRALDRLPPATRAALLARHAEDRSYEELARETGVGVSALKMRVARGTKQLRQALVAGGITAAAAVILLIGHRPARSAHRQTVSAVACDTLRALMHDTLPPGVRDSSSGSMAKCDAEPASRQTRPRPVVGPPRP